MANALALTAAAMPAAAGPLAGVADAKNSNGGNSASYTYANGAPGAADTIANAELLKGVSTTSRLYAFLNRTYSDQAELDATIAALGVAVFTQGASLFYFVRQGGGGPTATCTTATATGAIRISLGASVAA